MQNRLARSPKFVGGSRISDQICTKLGTSTSSLQKTFAHVVQIVEDFETEDGLRDLWRTAVMKFYSRAIAGRDFSLLETVHYGLRLPNTLSNFGPVRTVSLSGWTTVRSRRDLQLQAPTGRATYLNKIELFNARGQLKRPRSFDVRDLEGISLYAFWRLFDVQGNRLVRKRAEQFVAVSGFGWPAHAKQDHPSHDEYARRTLLCYMPCLGLRGTDWIEEKIAAEFRGQWKSALYHFVMDAQNEWCPTWIVRNYEAVNDVIQGLPALSSNPLVVPEDVEQQSSESLENIRKLPHAELFKSKFIFAECGEPGPIEDACGYEQAAIEDSWSKAERPAWQLHSALGPNIKPTQLSMRVAPLQEIVNPLHYDYTTNVFEVQPHAVNAFWEQVARTSSRYDDPSLHRELLRDDDQQLFVDLMLRHVKAVISFTLHTGPWVRPLRNAALTHDDYLLLCRLKRCHASASRRASFANAPVLMEFRRTTEQNEEHNCEHYNRQRLRVMANIIGVPVFAFDALHDGKPHADAMHIDDGSFAGLQKHLEIAEGALVILTHNLAVKLGLINGSQGKIVCVIFSPGRQPNHQDERCRMPWVILVDFPCYSGPPFLTCAHEHHWVPVLARSARCDEDRAITRTQFPLCFAYALTPWKAQGMTLAQVIVKLRTAGAKPGVLLVALSRVRHPDDILLEDDFPSYTQILSQSKSANFQARQQ